MAPTKQSRVTVMETPRDGYVSIRDAKLVRPKARQQASQNTAAIMSIVVVGVSNCIKVFILVYHLIPISMADLVPVHDVKKNCMKIVVGRERRHA